MIKALKEWARGLKRDIGALAIAMQDVRTPWYAKAIALAVVAYAVSPIDLIPDFVPVLGLVDDLILLPLGIMLAVRLVPDSLFEEFRQNADNRLRVRSSAVVPAAIVALWLLLAGLFLWWLF